MSSRDVRAQRKALSRNALNPPPASAAIEALGSHLRDAPRTKSERVGTRPARGTTGKGK
ncbi:hypothetical protein PQR64_33855 [Paraburkholderia phytofirmans]|uniref:hypothetical protein n=1 Tax=Paraburkholderia phytofirmans TaxID=261302 RepID=UPI0038B9AC2F